MKAPPSSLVILSCLCGCAGPFEAQQAALFMMGSRDPAVRTALRSPAPTAVEVALRHSYQLS
jgi:hypothetical protein